MKNDKDLYKKIPSHIEEIKEFEVNINSILYELKGILEKDYAFTQNGLLIELGGKIDKIIQALEISQNYDGFIGQFYSEVFCEIALIASKINETQNFGNKKITSLIEILNYTKEELSKVIKQANSLDEKSFA